MPLVNLRFLAKFLVSGGLSALTLYLLLLFFHEKLNWPVVPSSTLSYALSMVVGFTAQKLWTFRDQERKVVFQFAKYASLGIFNIGANAVFMTMLVNKWGVHYLVAQFFSLSVITAWSFLFYRFYVFQPVPPEHKPPAGL